jgi:hypothetical protein
VGDNKKTWDFHKLRGIKLGPGFVPAAKAARLRSQLRQVKQIQAFPGICTLEAHYGLCSVKQHNDVTDPRYHTYVVLTRHNHQIYVFYETQSAS